MDLGLKGKTAVITGGSGGIGQGLVLEFAREGLNVVSASRDAVTGEKLARKAEDQGCEGRILAVSTDVTDRESVDRVVGEIETSLGLPDLVVLNAGAVVADGPKAEVLRALQDGQVKVAASH